MQEILGTGNIPRLSIWLLVDEICQLAGSIPWKCVTEIEVRL